MFGRRDRGTEMSEPLFWIVWCIGGGSPTVRHEGFHAARDEARRLARNNPGQQFVVCAAAVGYIKRDVDEVGYLSPDTWRALDEDIPF